MNSLAENVDQLRAEAEAMIRTATVILRQLGGQRTASDTRSCITEIKQVVCEHYGLPVTVMRSRVRTQEFAAVRHIAIFIARELLPNAPLIEIAHAFRDDMDHGTVLYACKALTKRIQTEPPFATTISNLRGRCAERIASIDMPLFSIPPSTPPPL